MITFQIERVADCWDDIAPLIRKHWEGTKTYRRHEPFNPDRERYIAYNEMGFFHLITARHGLLLIGYFGVYITKSMHSQIPMATEDTFFLHPEYRGGRTAIRFMRYVESYCFNLGVDELLFSCEIDNETGIKKILTFLDYEPKILQFSKHLRSTHGADSAAMPVGDHGKTHSLPA